MNQTKTFRPADLKAEEPGNKIVKFPITRPMELRHCEHILDAFNEKWTRPWKEKD